MENPDDVVFPFYDDSAVMKKFYRRRESDDKSFDDRSMSPSTVDSGLDFDVFDSSLSPSSASYADSDKAVCVDSERIQSSTFLNGYADWSGAYLHTSFNKLYDCLTKVDREDYANGVDSPYRLYNRKSSFTPLRESAENSDDAELQDKKPAVKSYTLSSSAPIFVPSASKPSKSWTSFSGPIFELPKMFPSYVTVPVSVLPQQPISFLTSTPVKMHQRRTRSQRVCIYCQRAGYDAEMYESHCLRNPFTKAIICPVLEEHLCKLCGNVDEDWLIHTTRECSKLSKLAELRTFDL